MRTRHLKLKLMLALPVVAMLAIPGEAKPVIENVESAQGGGISQSQTAFGLFLDPHIVPVLQFAPPAAPWQL